MITLKSDRLRIEIAEPLEEPNTTSRFERAGFVSDVILDGAVHFGANEPKNLWHPSTGGRGFCNEYRADYSTEVETGEYFPKLGIGLFPKNSKPHIFHMRYNNIQEYPVTVKNTEREAVFETDAIECLGIAMKTTKKISVYSNKMIMETTAENVGKRQIDTIEFCHNFISIDGYAIGPDYHIELPDIPNRGDEQCIDINGKLCNWKGDQKGYTFIETNSDISHIPVDLGGYETKDFFTWKLRNDGAKAYVEGKEYYVPDGMEIWSVDHIISPEIFNRVILEPGEKKTWKREWIFDLY